MIFVCALFNFGFLAYSAYVGWQAYQFYMPETSVLQDLDDTDDAMTVEYAKGETFAATYFNALFFSATTNCESESFLISCHIVRMLYCEYSGGSSWFWNWVNSNCPSTMSSLNCQGCHSYSLTFCQANEGLCSSPTEAIYCPYAICRKEALQFFHQYLVQ